MSKEFKAAMERYFDLPRKTKANKIILAALEPFAYASSIKQPDDSDYRHLAAVALLYEAEALIWDAAWPFIVIAEQQSVTYYNPQNVDWAWLSLVYKYALKQITKEQLLANKPSNLPHDAHSLRHLRPKTIINGDKPLTLIYRPGEGTISNIIFSGTWPIYRGQFQKGHPCRGEKRAYIRDDEYPKSRTNIGKFRSRGYWASCFPEGDGITFIPLKDQSQEQVLLDIATCFQVPVSRST